MWNFPYFESYVKEKMQVDVKKVLAHRKNAEYEYTHPVTGQKETGFKIIRRDNDWSYDLGYFGKIRFDFFEESEKETLAYLDILGISKNYFRYYAEYSNQRLLNNIPYLMGKLENLTREQLLEMKEKDYDRWEKLRDEAESRTSEILRYRAIMGHNQDEEVDVVLFWFYDNIVNYIEAVPEKQRLRCDTPMMFWKNAPVYPDLDEKFQVKLKKWWLDIDEEFFPRTAEELAMIEADKKKRMEEVAKARAENEVDDISVCELLQLA